MSELVGSLRLQKNNIIGWLTEYMSEFINLKKICDWMIDWVDDWIHLSVGLLHLKKTNVRHMQIFYKIIVSGGVVELRNRILSKRNTMLTFDTNHGDN